MNLTPCGLKLIVKPIPKKEEEIGGIIIPETANADLREGEVVAVSKNLSGVIEIGDTVIYPSKKGVGQYINNEPHLWLDAEPNLDQIWAVIQKQSQ